jgi:hypothetical protein
MDYELMTAPCGRDCFNCPLHLAKTSNAIKRSLMERFGMSEESVGCDGCRNIEGRCSFLHTLGFSEQCKIYACTVGKGVRFCYECDQFPCELLQPLADRADKFPHNLKVYNLCLIKKLGVAEWAKTKAKESFDRYYKGKLDL